MQNDALDILYYDAGTFFEDEKVVVCVKLISDVKELNLLINDCDAIDLYGMGDVGRVVWRWLENNGMQGLVRHIFQSEVNNDNDVFNGTKIEQYKKNIIGNRDVLLISTTSRYAKEILNILSEKDREKTVCIADSVIKKIRIYLHEARITEKIKDKYNMRKKDALLITPPYWDVYSPFSAVPSLSAWLKRENYDVSQIDLGIMCFQRAIKEKWSVVVEYFWGEKYWEEVVSPYKNNPYKSIDEYRKDLYFIKEKDIHCIKENYFSFNDVQRMVYHDSLSAICAMCVSDIDFDNCENIHEIIDSYYDKVFFDTLEDDAVIEKLAFDVELVGISVTSYGQFIPVCVLAGLIKAANPRCKTLFGGSCADLFIKSDYKNKSDISEYFDYISIGEGETCLAALLERLKRKESTSNILGLIPTSNCDSINLHEVGTQLEEVENCPVPDYDDLDLSMYMSPRKILPYQASRGCHYGYCAFCNHDEKYRHNYRTKSAQKVVDDLINLHYKYDVNYFQFVDEAIRPDKFKEIVMEMDKHTEFRTIKWFYYSRVSRQYDDEILKIAKRNGCEMVMFGVETLNQRLLGFIKKGITADTSRYCMKLFHENEVKVYSWLLCSLPSETLDEVKKDYEDVIEQLAYIDSFYIGRFCLYKNTDMYDEPEKYNIISKCKANPTKYVSHNNGEIVDNDAIEKFYNEVYAPLMYKHCVARDRYMLFFNNI